MTNTVFRLESLGYQTDAVNAVTGVFKGAAPSSFGTNDCSLAWAQIEANLQDVAKSQQISQEHLHLTQPEQGQALDLCIEMETGTGKTLVYLRTIYKLHSEYGWPLQTSGCEHRTRQARYPANLLHLAPLRSRSI